MNPPERLRADLGEAMKDADSALAAADLLCHACVDLLEVDGASISLTAGGSTRGTFGSSGELSRRLDEYQFTFGEGPCLDAVREQRPVLVPDLADPAERRWPAFAGAVLEQGVHAVFALPVSIASSPVGAIDFFSKARGPLSDHVFAGGLLAAELAAVPLLELMTVGVDWDAGPDGRGWEQLASLERVEVYQATGMIVGALDIDPAEALVRLRAHAFVTGMTASEVAWAIVERRITIEGDDWPRGSARPDGAAA
jgi:hypothetical protein